MSARQAGMEDTQRAVEARRAELLREMSPRRKVELVEDANRTARRLALAGIAVRHPAATPEQRERILLGLLLGEAVAGEIYGPPPDLADDSG